MRWNIECTHIKGRLSVYSRPQRHFLTPVFLDLGSLFTVPALLSTTGHMS